MCLHIAALYIHYPVYYMRYSVNPLQRTLNTILFSLQRAQNRRVTYADLAAQIGVSHRTFAEWMRGACEPAAMEAILAMLSMLPNEDVVRAIDAWRGTGSAESIGTREKPQRKPSSVRQSGARGNQRSRTRPRTS